MDNRVDEATTPAEAGVPRRFAVQSIVGSLAGLAALGIGSADAQERKKAAKKKAAKKSTKKKAAKQTVGAQHANQRGLLVRVRQVIDAVNVPSNSNRVLTLVCPRAQSNEQVFVMGGGFTHAPFRADFVIRTSAPNTARSWVVDGHNVNTGTTIELGGYAICAYFRK